MTITVDKSARYIRFVVYSETPITPSSAREIQAPDYPVAGYGFEGFRCVEDTSGMYKATWHCAAVCE